MDLIAIIALILISAFVLGMMNASPPSQSRKLNYKKRESLLTRQELRFHKILLVVCENKYSIQTMVRVADVIKPISKKYSKDWRTSFNKIQSKHFDFVLCDPSTFEPIIIIELDDSSHNNPKNKQRDEVKNQACETAKLPILRHKIQSKYDPFELNTKIMELLEHQK